MKIALFCMHVMLKEIFISFYEFVPAAQNYSAFGILHRVVGILCILLVVYLLSSVATNEQIDFLKGSFENKECEQSTWRDWNK